MIVLWFVDKFDKEIYLTNERWKHITSEHPEVSSYIHYFGEVLKNPTKIVDYTNDFTVKYYYKYLKERNDTKYLFIIVKYLNGEGFIVTSYFVRNIK